MAMNEPNAAEATRNLGVGAEDTTQRGSDEPGNVPAVLAGGGTSVMAPIVVPNTLWTSVNPQAYVLDPTGLVLDRKVPGSRSDFEAMARDQRRRAANGAGAAAGSEKVVQGT